MSNLEMDLVRDAKLKAARFCAYQERAPSEVRTKLSSYGLEAEQLEQVMVELADGGFVNERRFALAYARGKLRLKKWGKLKIKRGLENYEIDPQCISEILMSLSPEDYHQTMSSLIEKKRANLRIADVYIRNHKIANFVISKGFEPELVWDYLKNEMD